MSAREREATYVISIAAQILHVHPQTLRLYEREGLIEPQRSRGGLRRYAERDLERVRTIKRLMDDLGVNLAGAEVILHMRETIMELQEEMERLRRELDIDLEM